MYVNERDQINYHGFLRALREMNQVSQEAVSIGICTVSGMNRFENGNRIAEKLMRDRLTARLGISGEKYEDYLQPKEYVKWQHRLRIVKAIEKRKLGLAKKELHSYEQLPRLNDLNKQFVEAMRFMILSMEDASEEVLLECVNKAVKYTVPNVDKALAGLHLLADQEINLIAEKIRLTQPNAVVRDERAWRISEYEKLISYMENSHWELLQKAKVYPKVTYYICQLLLETEPTESELRRGLELCHTAIELLRDSSRLYYFIELTEIRRTLAEGLLVYDITDVEKHQLKEMLTENNDWERVFKDLYAEYDVAPYMSNFCYLYYETECHDMAEVIEIRRNMLGLSRVKLSDGICTERTIVRFEREGRNPNIEVVRLLFERLGLCAEYRRARVVTNDAKGLLLSTELVKLVNNRDEKELEEGLARLKKSLCLDLPYNKQEVIRNENQISFFKREMDNKEYYDKIKNALECTIPLQAVIKSETVYLTKTEIRCVTDLGFVGEGDKSSLCREIIFRIYEDIVHKNMQMTRISELEFMAQYIESYLGNSGKFEKSTQIGQETIKECFSHKRLNNIATHLYNNLWNLQQNSFVENEDVSDDYVIKCLNNCVLLCELIKKNKAATFYYRKLFENKN